MEPCIIRLLLGEILYVVDYAMGLSTISPNQGLRIWQHPFHLTDSVLYGKKGVIKEFRMIYRFLCTASLYAPYSSLLISNKFWMGGEGGEARGPSWQRRIRGVEGENKRVEG